MGCPLPSGASHTSLARTSDLVAARESSLGNTLSLGGLLPLTIPGCVRKEEREGGSWLGDRLTFLSLQVLHLLCIWITTTEPHG